MELREIIADALINHKVSDPFSPGSIEMSGLFSWNELLGIADVVIAAQKIAGSEKPCSLVELKTEHPKHDYVKVGEGWLICPGLKAAGGWENNASM